MIPYRGEVPRPRLPWVTIGLIAVNVVVFAYQATLGVEGFVAFVQQWGAVPAEIVESLGEQPWAVWTWLVPSTTSIFIHGGLWHLLLNMLFLWVFGEAVENGIGPGKFFVIYMLAGVGAVLVQTLFIPGSELPMVGASGAVAGVLGMYVLLYPLSKLRVYFPPAFIFRISAMVFIMAWFFYQIFAGLAVGRTQEMVGGVAWWAHVGGFVIGVVVHLLIARDTVNWSDEVPREQNEQPA